MFIYALVGPSGTGKSSSALLVAHEHNIPAIIDDGLLIYKGKRVAGSSAKFEKNYITAVKRATFYMPEHREEVLKAIKQYKIKKLLIIGTSKRMVDKIASRLNLGPIDRYIDVTEIRTPSEIKMALYVRNTQGKHVIPVPYLQIEQNFFKKMIKKGKQLVSRKREYIGETTIVHPDFTPGTIHIADKVFKAIVERTVSQFDNLTCKHVQINLYQMPTVQVYVSLQLPVTRSLKQLGLEIQKRMIEEFQNIFELELESVNIRFE